MAIMVPVIKVFWNGSFTFDQICEIANSTKEMWSTESELITSQKLRLTIGNELYIFETKDNVFTRESLYTLTNWIE